MYRALLFVLVFLGLEAIVACRWWPLQIAPRSTLHGEPGEAHFLRGFSPDSKTLISFYDSRHRQKFSFGLAL